MNSDDNPIIRRARANLLGRRTTALPPAQVRRNVRSGPDAESSWPFSARTTNPAAARLANAVEEAK